MGTKQGWVKRKLNGNGIPWNKGRNDLPKHTEEHKRKIGLKSLGNTYGFQKGVPSWNKDKFAPWATGENHWDWKGGINRSIKRRMKIYNAEGLHTKLEWDALKKKYNYMCLCCKQQEPSISLCEDHIVPLSMGGSNYISNIQPLCKSCNSRKHIKIIDFTMSFRQTTVA